MKLKKRIELLEREIELLRQIKELREQIASAPVVPGTPYPVITPTITYEKAPYWMNPDFKMPEPTCKPETISIPFVWSNTLDNESLRSVTTVAHTGDADGFTVARGAGLF